MDSDNDGDGHDSDEEGGPGTKEVKQVLSYAEHQKIKLDRLFEKCKDGRAVFIPEMPSKIPSKVFAFRLLSVAFGTVLRR